MDTLGLIGQLLDIMMPGQLPAPPQTKTDNGYRTFDFTQINDWITA